MSTQDLGKKGEDLAVAFLKSQKYKILERNFRSRFGEIDIIAKDCSGPEEVLVFVEVKTRWSKKFGLPEEAVTAWKLRSIGKTGDYFQMLHSDYPKLLRIDVVAVSLSPGGEVERINLIKNAEF